MENLPKLIYGTAWKKDRTTECVELAIKCGFRAVDTACQPKHYAEDLVGDALLKVYACGIKRDELFIQTKFTPFAGQDPLNTPYDKSAPLDKQIYESFDVSKKNLKTDYLNSLILHSPIYPYKLMQTAWQVFENIYKNGDTRNLGISNCYDLELLQKIVADANTKPTFIQNRFYDQSGYDKELREWCSKNNIIYQSFWSLTANPHILASQTIVTIAQKYEKTVAQIFFRYLSSTNIIPLIGSTTKEHIVQDLAIFEFELTQNEIEQINLLL